MQPVTDPWLERIVYRAERQSSRQPGDYLDNEGLLCCGRCGTRKQTNNPSYPQPMPILCRCRKEAREEEKARRAEEERVDRIRRLRTTGIRNIAMQSARFESSGQGNLRCLEKCRSYAEHWAEMQEKGLGLYLYGNVGCGKTYAAACIANALIDRNVPVLMLSAVDAAAELSREGSDLLRELEAFDLVILDDLGADRGSQYTLEATFRIVDTRVRSGKPLIVTSNIRLADLQRPPDQARQRIYDRILERCVPLDFSGQDLRLAAAAQNRCLAAQILG